MNGEAVKEIAKLAGTNNAPVLLDIHGRKNLMTPLPNGGWDRTEMGGDGPDPAALAVHTLAGFVAYVNQAATAVDRIKRETLAVHVVNHGHVRLHTGLGDYGTRKLLLSTSFEELLGPAGMVYGRFMDLESFNIALQTVFADTEDRTKALLVAGTVRDEEVVTSTDDGVSQTVVASAGVVAATRTVVPNPVKLRPFRTFREVAQPESLFILRMKRVEGSKPAVALFEADGGAWKLEAIENIRAYLAAKVTGVPILA